MARWEFAKNATTPFVMSLDDDICFKCDSGLEKIVLSLEQQSNPKRIIGFVGACFSNTLNYNVRREHMCRYGDINRQVHPQNNTFRTNNDGEVVFVKRDFIEQDESVDLVKGRVMAFRTELLANMDFPEEREDDIFLNATFANGARCFHKIPMLLNDVFYELPEHQEGNWLKPGHVSSRNRALKDYFFFWVNWNLGLLVRKIF